MQSVVRLATTATMVTRKLSEGVLGAFPHCTSARGFACKRRRGAPFFLCKVDQQSQESHALSGCRCHRPGVVGELSAQSDLRGRKKHEPRREVGKVILKVGLAEGQESDLEQVMDRCRSARVKAGDEDCDAA